MARFSFKVRDFSGKIIMGSINADTLSAAAKMLRDNGLSLIYVRRQTIGLHWHDILSWWEGRQKKEYVPVLCRQLAAMMSAGIPLNEALLAIAEDTEVKAHKNLALELARDIEIGLPIDRALKNQGRVFNDAVIALMKAGEYSGTLDEVMQRLAGRLEAQYRARKKLRGAMAYPLLLTLVMIVVALFMSVYVLPSFITLFDGLHIDLPLPTKVLIYLSKQGQNNFIVIIAGIGFLVALFNYMLTFPKIKIWFDYWQLKWPLFGTLRRYIHWQQILDTMAILLQSGVVIDEAIMIAKDVANNQYLSQLLERTAGRVRSGHEFTFELRHIDILSKKIISLLRAGERSGTLEQMLEKSAAFYDTEATSLMVYIQALAEPVMILFIGGLIFMFVLSIALPLLDVMTAL